MSDSNSASAYAHRKAMVNGMTFHYLTAGEGPALLLLHGWMGTSYSWRKVIAPLAEHFTVIAPDMRGYGDSDKPYSGYDGITLKNDVRAIIQSLGFEKVSVVGHDMGALPALLYAAHHPDEVQWLGYLDEPLVGYNDQDSTAFTKDNPFVYWWFPFNATPHVPAMLWEGKETQMVNYFLSAMIADQSSITENDKKEYVRGLTSPGGLEGSFGWYRDVLTTGEQIRDATTGKMMDVPVLGLSGEYGHPGVKEQFEPIANTVDGGVIPFCGHMLAEEQPGMLVDHITKFDGKHGKRLG